MKRRLLSYTIILTATLAMFYHSRIYSTSDNNVQLNQSTATQSISNQQVSQYVYASSVSKYRTTLDLNAEELNQSHELTITGTAGLSGELRLDGKLLSTFDTNGTSIDLAPYLSRGRHIITLAGPARGTIQMTFTGPGINLTHQASSSGWIDIELTLEVW